MISFRLGALAALLLALTAGGPAPAQLQDRPGGGVEPRALDISIRKLGPSQVIAGQTATFTLHVANGGPGSAGSGDIVVTDTLPASFASPVARGLGWACRQVTGLIISCRYVGPAVAPGGRLAPITVIARAVTAGGFVQCASAQTLRASDPKPGDNRNCTNGRILPGPPDELDLSIRKSSLTGLSVGQSVTFTLAPRNNGPGPAGGGVTVVDMIPVKFAQVRASGLGWTCTVSSGSPPLVTCLYFGPTVAAGAPMPNIVITAMARSDGPYLQCAEIGRRGVADPNPADNRSCVEGHIKPDGLAAP